MLHKTKDVRSAAGAEREVDAVDRKLLALLAEDAQRSFQELGAMVHLSPPAVHERVKRLKAAGRIRGTVALVDPAALGRTLLAFVHVSSTGWGKSPELLALSALPEVEEIHSVTGDACAILKVRVKDGAALEGLLQRIYDAPGVVSTKSYVVLSTYAERPPQGGVTEALGA